MIVVLKPGMLASVQDLGRHGHRERGICPGGALDALGLTLANRLVGNADGAAGLELTLGACEFRFETDTRIALAGDDFDARLDGLPLRPGWSTPVSAGQRVVLGGANASAAGKKGVRSWLAVAGGIDVAPVLGSRSTDLKAGFGGHQGRPLKKGDRLPLGPSPLDAAQRARRAFGVRTPAWTLEGQADLGDAIALRVMPGPECELFTATSVAALWREPWRLTPQSNRMGSRLEGPVLARRRAGDMLSSGVVPGTVQVPPSGQPIVLMGDAQTTGGYPRIGVVIRADLWKLAQAPLGGTLRLLRTDVAEATQAWAAQQRYLAQVAQGLAASGWPAGRPHPG
ncbi:MULTISPECIES: biotin-dependent carboxyltransferase family protein [unclassified Variovorax]|uniref:5-oxoprolinase subunit C family protein n=1 Tax=unclassified Variovorax TaxID=663243 RepID=UPI002578847E|nr:MULTISPECIES: biotin-dependent carboxyltransferase family protein [unclassified Variovorax]MDM0091616.1 biotin-dependent carboxyltransferase family protein [Variovorax sp. J22G40]MDM0145972.1 biotin-dependent carboxyltransferase family protein [Variovorax sp. J2P1-31]